MTTVVDLSGNGQGAEFKQYVKLETASSGDNTVYLGKPGRIIRAYEVRITVAAAVIVIAKSGSTELDEWNFGANGDQLILTKREKPYLVCAEGESLIFNLSGATAIDAMVLVESSPA